MDAKNLVSAIAAAGSISAEAVCRALVRTKDIAHGDYAFPCFPLAKEWKLSPPDCAKKLQQSITLPSGFERCEVVGPYLNFFFERKAFVQETVRNILAAGLDVGKADNSAETYVIDYSSPNIAKPFHVGHLRATLIGMSLDRLYRHLGYKVVAINHLGDWGTQFGFVYAGFKVWGLPEKPSVDDFVDRYRRASGLRKAQDEKTVAAEDADKPEINQIARDYFIRLEAGDKEATDFWQWVLDISMEYFKNAYARIGARFDHYMGESFYRDKLPKVEVDLKAAGILTESRGALGVDLGKKLGYVRIFAEDGRSLYITRDLATADYRHNTFHPDKILIVIGNPQELYFRQLAGVLEKMGHPIAQRIVHVGFGHVPGISTRKAAAGDERISLTDLLDDAHDRALEAYRAQVDKKPEGLDEGKVAEAVGLGAVFFDYLSRTNNKDFHFDWDTALSFQGDTGPYILYALARLNSIEAKAKEAGINAGVDFDVNTIVDDGSYRLVALLSRFDDVLAKAAEEREPYHIALYTLDLAKSISAAYRELRVLGEAQNVAQARLSLFLAARNVLLVGLTLIGMKGIDRM